MRRTCHVRMACGDAGLRVMSEAGSGGSDPSAWSRRIAREASSAAGIFATARRPRDRAARCGDRRSRAARSVRRRPRSLRSSSGPPRAPAARRCAPPGPPASTPGRRCSRTSVLEDAIVATGRRREDLDHEIRTATGHLRVLVRRRLVAAPEKLHVRHDAAVEGVRDGNGGVRGRSRGRWGSRSTGYDPVPRAQESCSTHEDPTSTRREPTSTRTEAVSTACGSLPGAWEASPVASELDFPV